MQPTNTTRSVSYSDLPTLCIPVICTQLGGSKPIVRIRTVNQDFHAHTRIPLAESILQELKAINYLTSKEPAERLRQFRHYLGAVREKNYLPERFRLLILCELCRIVNTLPNEHFISAWRDMVAQFNTESEEMRAQLQAAMDANAGRCELYGDGGVAFVFKKPAW